MEITVAVISAGSAIIVGLLSFVGVIITNNRSNNKMHMEVKTNQAVTNEQIKELTREVRKHNDFASRIPLAEAEIERMNKRIKELEGLHKREV